MNQDMKKATLMISKSKIEIIIGKYAIYIGVMGSLLIIIFSIIALGGIGSLKLPGMKVVFLCCGFLVLLSIFARNHHKKFAYSIDINFANQWLVFRMYKGESIRARFEQLKKVLVNGYVFFELQDNTIIYNDLSNKLLFETINKIKKIEWGEKCLVWGPPKEFRKKLEDDC